MQLHAHGVIGRSLSAFEDTNDAAVEELATAVAEARRINLPFVELMLARDLTVVAGEDPMSPAALQRLGGPLVNLVITLAELDPLLGPGFDPAAALRAVQLGP